MVGRDQRVRALLHESKVRIPAGNRRLLQQLRQVVSKPTPGGQLTITSPRRGGAHGDLASAFVLAAWDAQKHGAARPLAPLPLNLGPPSRWEGMPGRGFG